MTSYARIEYSLIVSITLPDGTSHNLRHTFDSLTKANDVAAWFKRQPDTYVCLTEVRIAETFTPLPC